MSNPPEDQVQWAHKHFSTECFNRAWDSIDNPGRTPEEDEQMLSLSMASLWHWTQRPDHTLENLSVAYWQVSRVLALVGQPQMAMEFGRKSLQASTDGHLPAFLIGYSYEALARAAGLAGDDVAKAKYLSLGMEQVQKVTEVQAKEMLLMDLSSI